MKPIAQQRHLGQLLAAEADADRGHEADADARLLAGLRDDAAQQGRIVEHRRGVRHRNDGAVAAGGGGARARLEILLVLLARRTEVDVRVDEGREEVLARRLDRFGAGRGVERAGRCELGDLAAADQDVMAAVDLSARIEDVSFTDQ